MGRLEILFKGQSHQIDLKKGSHSIGSSKGNDIVIRAPGIEACHAVIICDDRGEVSIQDVSKAGGIWLEGTQLAPGATYQIKEAVVYTIGKVEARYITSSAAAANTQKSARKPSTDTSGSSSRPDSDILLQPNVIAYMDQIHKKTLAYLDLHKRATLHSLSTDELRREAYDAIAVVIEDEDDPNLGVSPDELVEPIVAEAVGLGPLEPLLADEQITEIMVNGYEQIYVEEAGRIRIHKARFSSHESLMAIIERIVTPLGRRIDEGVPMVDARLRDGSRVNAIIPPLSLSGAILTIRKFSKTRLLMKDLLNRNTVSEDMAKFMQLAVRYRMNIIISGGTGSGKTTTLNILSDDIPDRERIVTVEDSAELQLSQEHVISLEGRPPNVEGKGEVSIRDLVKNCLRMRPDRIVVGECRSGEALDMLQAMNTGHDGSLTTGHANSPRDLLSRLEVMVLMSGVDLPVRAIREQIASAVDLIIQQTRFSDGGRRITNISAVDGMEGDTILMQKLFEYVQTGVDKEGNVIGHFRATGEIPKFYERLLASGVDVDISIFGKRPESQNDDW